MTQPNWDNVLVLQTAFLGDMVLTLPLIAEIRRRFPVKRLTLLCTAAGRDLLEGHPAIDEVIVDDKKNTHGGWGGLNRQAQALRRCEFTIALTPHKSARTALMLYRAAIPTRVGFRQSKGWFLFDRRAQRDPARHDVERNLAVLEPFGVQARDCVRRLFLPLPTTVAHDVDECLSRLGVASGRPAIGINPGTVWPTKRWWPQGFASLIKLAARKNDWQLLLFGGPDDRPVAQEILERSEGGAIDLTGKFTLRQLPAAIGRCQAFITNDSGPMHIAVARGVPTVAIFCATTPELGFYPYTNNAVVIQKALACRPCTSHGGRRCPLVHEDCIRQISPQAVLGAVERLLARSAEQAHAERGEMNGFVPEFIAA